MDAPQVGEVHEHAARLVDAPCDSVVVHAVFRLLYQQVDLLLGQAVDLAQFPEDGAVAEGGDGADKGGVLPPIALEDVVQHLVPFLPGEIDVEIGGTGPLGIDETFEIEVQVDGVHIGDPQAVGHNGVGPASPAHMVEAPGHGVADHIPGDQEVGGETQAVDDLQFMFDPPEGLPVVSARNGIPCPPWPASPAGPCHHAGSR